MAKLRDYYHKTTNLYSVRSVGYYMGYQDCKQYYNKATDKRKALQEIIEVTDYDGLVGESGF